MGEELPTPHSLRIDGETWEQKYDRLYRHGWGLRKIAA